MANSPEQDLEAMARRIEELEEAVASLRARLRTSSSRAYLLRQELVISQRSLTYLQGRFQFFVRRRLARRPVFSEVIDPEESVGESPG